MTLIDISTEGLHERSQFRHEVKTTNESIDELTGLTLRRVDVWDESLHSPTLESMQSLIANAQKLLVDHPEWLAPVDLEDGTVAPMNPVSEWVYQSPAMADWRKSLVPSAKALYPMQRPDIIQLPGPASLFVDSDAHSFFMDALDSIGIRTRARVMTSIAEKNIKDDESVRWVSLACGAAVPVLDALQIVNKRNVAAQLTLVDIDSDALNFASQLALEKGLLPKDDFEVMQVNLAKELIFSNALIDRLGNESAQMIDALGIFEYFNDKHAAMFIKQAFRLVQPGGTFVAANMLSDRPELDFNQRGIGWPKIFPRSIEEITELIVRSGISLKDVCITIPQDEVYAVIEIRKPKHEYGLLVGKE